MPRRDFYHEAFKEALEKDGWTITHDPLALLSKKEGGLQTDVGAEKVVTAEKDLKKIAVEIKSFVTPSALHEFIKSTGQYRAYRLAMDIKNSDRFLFIAIPTFAWKIIANKEIVQALIDDLSMKIVLYDPVEKIISEWKE